LKITGSIKQLALSTNPTIPLMHSVAPMYLILCLVLFPSQGAKKKQIFKTYRIAYNTVKQVHSRHKWWWC